MFFLENSMLNYVGINTYQYSANRPKQKMAFKGSVQDIAAKKTDLANSLFSKGFDSIKKKVTFAIEKYDASRVIPLKEAKNPLELFDAVLGYQVNLASDFMNNFMPNYLEVMGKGATDLKLEKTYHSLAEQRSKISLDLYESLVKPSQNKDVQALEKRLKNEFEIDAKLNDDLELGKKIHNVSKLFKEAGKTLPDKVLVNDIFLVSGEAIRLDGKNIVALKSSRAPEDESLKDMLSTKSPLHVVAHEYSHLQHTNLLAMFVKEIPKNLDPAIEGLGRQSSANASEAFAEVSTKEILEKKLTKSESKLYEYLGGEIMPDTKIVEDAVVIKSNSSSPTLDITA